MLNQGTVMDDGIHFTKDGKEYVIQETTQPGETKLSNAEIVDRLKKMATRTTNWVRTVRSTTPPRTTRPSSWT